LFSNKLSATSKIFQLPIPYLPSICFRFVLKNLKGREFVRKEFKSVTIFNKINDEEQQKAPQNSADFNNRPYLIS